MFISCRKSRQMAPNIFSVKVYRSFLIWCRKSRQMAPNVFLAVSIEELLLGVEKVGK